MNGPKALGRLEVFFGGPTLNHRGGKEVEKGREVEKGTF
jgi:hypothetical protein